MKKQYNYENVVYGFSLKFKKWVFRANNYVFVASVSGGHETAHKIAHLINAGLVRNQKKGKFGIDELCRANINRVLA